MFILIKHRILRNIMCLINGYIWGHGFIIQEAEYYIFAFISYTYYLLEVP